VAVVQCSAVQCSAVQYSTAQHSTVHIYTQTIHRTTQNKQYTEQHNNFGGVLAVPRLGELYPGICLTTEEKARKNLIVTDVFRSGKGGGVVDRLEHHATSMTIRCASGAQNIDRGKVNHYSD